METDSQDTTGCDCWGETEAKLQEKGFTLSPFLSAIQWTSEDCLSPADCQGRREKTETRRASIRDHKALPILREKEPLTKTIMPVTIQHIEACEAQQGIMKGLGFEQIDTSDDQSVCWVIRFFGGDHFVEIKLLPSAAIEPSSVLLLAMSSAFGAGQRQRAKAIRDLLTD